MRILIFLCTMLISASASARNYHLSIDEAITLALNQGFDAKQSQLQLDNARHNMDVSQRRTKTSVDLRLQAPNFTERVTPLQQPNQLPIYNTIGNLTWGSALQLTQPILLTDGRITLQSDFQQLRQSIFQEQIDATDRSKRFVSSLSIRFNQPLFVPNQLKLNLERAQLQLARSQQTFTSTQLNVVYNITQFFYNTYSAQRRLEIAKDALAQQTQSAELAQKKYEAGLIPEVDALLMEVDLARSRNQLLQAQGSFTRQSDALKLELGLSLDDSVQVHVSLELTHFDIDEEIAIAHGLKHQASLNQRQIDYRLSEIALKDVRSQGALRGDFSASYERTGIGNDPTEDISSRDLFDASWNDLRRRPRNLGLQLILTMPLWDSDLNRARVAQAQTQLDQSQLRLENQRQQVMLSIRNTIVRLRESQSRLDVLRRSEDVAKRTYEINLARFENGNITAQDLTQTRDGLTQARQNYLSAYIQYQIAIADLKRQTLYDFENNKSLAEE